MSADVLDRRARAADIGMWLFVASLVMFFGSLFSGYVLLRAGSETWVTPWAALRAGGGMLPRAWMGTAALAAAVALARRRRLFLAAMAGAVFVALWLVTQASVRDAGFGPATSVAAASWFVLTGAVAALVFGGAAATAWLARGARRSATPAHVVRLIERYWWLMLAFHVAIVLGMDVP